MEKYIQILTKFDKIYSITAKMKKKEKGNLFETFTYHLIKHDPRLNNGLEKIWMYNDIPKNILNNLDLPSTDKGIDLLAIINGKYYAIQCKFRQDPNKIISWSELSTFFGLSFGMNNKIAGGFLVTNTRNLCQEVINSKKVVPIYDDFYDDLTSNFFRNITSNKIIYERKYKNTPQIECVTAARVHFLENRRGYVEMACGTGKTLASYWIACSMSLGRTVIFVPSLQLLSQFYSDWVNQSYAEDKSIKYLLIGSDADVEDEIIEKSNGLILHLNPTDIRKHLSEDVVVICTYQSSDVLAEACGKKITFDFGIFDEAHKTVGQKGKQFSRMLTDDELVIKKRLFMTATPKIYVGDNDDIMSMDDKKIYGERIYTYNTGDAIAAKRLTDYQLLTIYCTNEEIKRDIQTKKLIKYKKEFDDKDGHYLGTLLIILKKIGDKTINHLITYHGTVSKAKKFVELLKIINKLVNNEDMYINSIDGNDSMRERKNTIREFSDSKIGILCAARVLNEGVNIPIVDSVCFVDPRESVIDIVQCVGRSLRLYEGKKMAYVIVPVFINDFEEEFDKEEYGTVIKILKALKNTDDGIIEYFGSRMHNENVKRKIIHSENYGVVDVSCSIDLDEWLQYVEAELWKVTDKWGFMYGKLRHWIEINKKIPSESSKNTDEHILGVFCTKQRLDKRRGKLCCDKIIKCEKLKNWFWEFDVDKTWNKMYECVKKFIGINKELPSVTSIDNNERMYEKWCMVQDLQWKKGSLSNYRIHKLQNLEMWYSDYDNDLAYQSKKKILFDIIFNQPNSLVTIIVDDKNDKWFPGSEIARLLEYGNIQNCTANNVDQNDKKEFSELKKFVKDVPKNAQPRSVYINEIGLYYLIFGSKTETARKLKREIIKTLILQSKSI